MSEQVARATYHTGTAVQRKLGWAILRIPTNGWEYELPERQKKVTCDRQSVVGADDRSGKQQDSVVNGRRLKGWAVRLSL